MYVTAVNRVLYQIATPYDKNGTVFLYLLKGDRIALVDTGVADSPPRVLRPALAEIGLALSDVELILNTHAHLDHTGGNAEMRKASKAPIHLHASDLPMALSNEAQAEFHTAPMHTLDFPREVVEERTQYVLRHSGQPMGADVLLREGDRVDLGSGIQLTAIHCPGHTPGHLCYYWESEGVLITGDAVQGQALRPGSFPYYFNASDYRRSLAKLAALHVGTLCAGHAFLGGSAINYPVRSGTEAREFLQASLQTADVLHRAAREAVKRSPDASYREMALAALSELIYDLPQLLVRQTGMPSHAGPSLLAHLKAAQEGSYPA